MSVASDNGTIEARDRHSNDKRVFWLGAAVLLTFLFVVMGAFGFCLYLIDSGKLTNADAGTVAAIFSLLGTLIGYAAANAQQVVGFNFGSSRGSQDKTAAMSKMINQLAAPDDAGVKKTEVS
jgi:hypothetical protein